MRKAPESPAPASGETSTLGQGLRRYARLFLLSAAATLLLDVPFLYWHGLRA